MTRMIATAWVVLNLACGFAQPSTPAFEAATVKPSKVNSDSSTWNSRPGYLVMRNQNFKALVRIAYNVKESQISGGPNWIESDRFDIEGRAAGAAKDPELMAMLRTLLAERFQLAFHRDSKLSSGFALVPAKREGMKIKPDPTEGKSRWNSHRGTVVAQRVSMAKLAEGLTGVLGSTVVDETNSKGVYSFTLEWSPEATRPVATPDGRLPDADLGPTLFTVLQERLGLKLEARKTPTEIIVIDRAERPSEN